MDILQSINGLVTLEKCSLLFDKKKNETHYTLKAEAFITFYQQI